MSFSLFPLLNIHFYQSILVSFYFTIFFSSYLFIVVSENLIRSSFARSFAVCDDRSPSRMHPSSISINLINPKSSVCAARIAVSERSLRLHLEIRQPFRPNVTRPRRGWSPTGSDRVAAYRSIHGRLGGIDRRSGVGSDDRANRCTRPAR